MPTFHAYPSFADFIASDPELSVFKRFNRLSSRNLLYLQSELLDLQAQLQDFDEEDYNGKDGEVLLSAKCWETFAARAEEPQYPREKERMETIHKIRISMKEYQEALVLRQKVLTLQIPGDRAFGAFSNWFKKFRPFMGLAEQLLEDQNDFVALGVVEEQDRLTKIIQDVGGQWLPRSRNSTSKEVKYYSEDVVNKVVAGITIVLAAILLEGAIVALYFITNPHLQLGLIALFMVLFAGSIGLLSNAKRSEMFAATAAYAAVLVVFVSGNLGGGKSTPP